MLLLLLYYLPMKELARLRACRRHYAELVSLLSPPLLFLSRMLFALL